jgi:hypothetical protein
MTRYCRNGQRRRFTLHSRAADLGSGSSDTSLDAARYTIASGLWEVVFSQPNGRALATWTQQPYMLGIRMVFNRGQSAQWLNDGTADWFWDAAENTMFQS